MQQEAAAEKLGLVSYRVEIVAGLQLGSADSIWHVRSLEYEEELSAPYRLTISLLTEHAVDVPSLAGARFRLAMHREDGDGDDRYVHGIVLQAIDVGRFSKLQHVRLLVGPELAIAELSVHSRIFQNTSVVDIVREVLGPQLQAEYDTSRLLHEHPPRDYCVQFRETDLAFVQRILAEDGIAFAFEHAEEKERIVLLDDPGAFRGAPSSVESGEPSKEPLSLPVATLGNTWAEREHASRFEWRRTMHPTVGVFEQWDWKAASPENLVGEAPQGAIPPWVKGEQVLFGDRRLAEAEADDGSGAHVDDSSDVLQRHLARRLRAAELAHGNTNALGLAAGTTVEIQGHPEGELNGTYYVTQAIHRADCPEEDRVLGGGSSFAGANYENEIECVPVGVPFYARVPEKPRVFGPQTATVVGPAGEDIHTDAYGRIQVRMHWDREQRDLDSGTSAWLRVAHSWAGPGWGTMFLPRVGMEVIVAFIDGDPDRPMCVGCVYNGKNMPPYALPDEKTKSTIKTRSTPGGQGSNELRFEDARGAEEVYLHAQKDLVERVENEHRVSIGAAETIGVGGSRTLKVSGNQDVTVGGFHGVTVEGKGVGNAPAPDPAHLLRVLGKMEQHAFKEMIIESPLSITLQCENSSIQLTPDGITLVSGTGAKVDLTAAIAMFTKGPALTVTMDDEGTFEVDNNTSLLTLDSAALEYTSPADASLRIDAGHTLTTEGATLAMTDSIRAKASEVAFAADPGAALELNDKATMTSNVSATMQVGGSMVEADTVAVNVHGTQVGVTGAAQVEVLAPNVKIN